MHSLVKKKLELIVACPFKVGLEAIQIGVLLANLHPMHTEQAFRCSFTWQFIGIQFVDIESFGINVFYRSSMCIVEAFFIIIVGDALVVRNEPILGLE